MPIVQATKTPDTSKCTFRVKKKSIKDFFIPSVGLFCTMDMAKAIKNVIKMSCHITLDNGQICLSTRNFPFLRKFLLKASVYIFSQYCIDNKKSFMQQFYET